jgi:hypothetical protein
MNIVLIILCIIFITPIITWDNGLDTPTGDRKSIK